MTSVVCSDGLAPGSGDRAVEIGNTDWSHKAKEIIKSPQFMDCGGDEQKELKIIPWFLGWIMDRDWNPQLSLCNPELALEYRLCD